MKPIKPGYQTTEFWVVIVSMVLSTLTANGLISQDQANELIKPVAEVTAAVVSLLAAAYYVKTRHDLKKSIVESIGVTPETLEAQEKESLTPESNPEQAVSEEEPKSEIPWSPTHS